MIVILAVFLIEGRLIFDIDTNSGNINILQNDIQELKSEILKKNDMINSMKRELSFINKRLEDEEKIDEISEGIVENALAEEKAERH